MNEKMIELKCSVLRLLIQSSETLFVPNRKLCSVYFLISIANCTRSESILEFYISNLRGKSSHSHINFSRACYNVTEIPWSLFSYCYEHFAKSYKLM